MNYEDYQEENYQSKLRQIDEDIFSVNRQIRETEEQEEYVLNTISTSIKRINELGEHWKGEEAERFIYRFEDNLNAIRKEYTRAYEEAFENLEDEKKRLAREEQNVYDKIREKHNENNTGGCR